METAHANFHALYHKPNEQVQQNVISAFSGGEYYYYCAFTPKAHKEGNDPGSHSLCIGSQADKEGKEE